MSFEPNTAASDEIGCVEIDFLLAASAPISTAAGGQSRRQPAELVGAHLILTAAVPAGTRKIGLILGGTYLAGSTMNSHFDVVEAELALASPSAGELTQLYAEVVVESESSVWTSSTPS